MTDPIRAIVCSVEPHLEGTRLVEVELEEELQRVRVIVPRDVAERIRVGMSAEIPVGEKTGVALMGAIRFLFVLAVVALAAACSSATTNAPPGYIGGCTWVDTDAGVMCETDASRE